jgi:hypothetical protein
MQLNLKAPIIINETIMVLTSSKFSHSRAAAEQLLKIAYLLLTSLLAHSALKLRQEMRHITASVEFRSQSPRTGLMSTNPIRGEKDAFPLSLAKSFERPAIFNPRKSPSPYENSIRQLVKGPLRRSCEFNSYDPDDQAMILFIAVEDSPILQRYARP